MLISTNRQSNLERHSEDSDNSDKIQEDFILINETDFPTPDFKQKLYNIGSLMQKFLVSGNEIDKYNVIYHAHDLIIEYPDYADMVIEFVENQPNLGRELRFAELAKRWLKLAYRKESIEPSIDDIKELIGKKLKYIIDRIRGAIGNL